MYTGSPDFCQKFWSRRSDGGEDRTGQCQQGEENHQEILGGKAVSKEGVDELEEEQDTGYHGGDLEAPING